MYFQCLFQFKAKIPHLMKSKVRKYNILRNQQKNCQKNRSYLKLLSDCCQKNVCFPFCQIDCFFPLLSGRLRLSPFCQVDCGFSHCCQVSCGFYPIVARSNIAFPLSSGRLWLFSLLSGILWLFPLLSGSFGFLISVR